MNNGLAVVGLVILVGLAISGCGPRPSAMLDLQSSKGKYKDCLKAYPNEESKCEVLRKFYEIDKGTVEAFEGGKVKISR
mgnify:CR=1 FL=1